MLKGGDRIWGDPSRGAPDDSIRENVTDSHANFITFRPANQEPSDQPAYYNKTVQEAIPFILKYAPRSWQDMMHTNYSHGFETDPLILDRNNDDHRKWINVRILQDT